MPNLLRKPFGTTGKVHDITLQSAGWRYVGFSLYRLRPGETAAEMTGEREVILVMVEGKASISGAGQDWGVLGDRMNAFEKTAPHCLYLPNGTDWHAVAQTDCTIAVCSAPGSGGHKARRIGPDGIDLTERGKGTHPPHQQYRNGKRRFCRQPACDRGIYTLRALVFLSQPSSRRR